MRVVIFRHGPAGSRDAARWPDDDLRPLTPRGEDRTRASAAGLARLEPKVRLIATSPLTRAAQTARIVGSVIRDAEIDVLDALRPGGPVRKIIEFLSAHASRGTVVLVGHEPDLGKLAGTLWFNTSVALPLRKAGACAFRFDGEIGPGTGQLRWFLPPRLLSRVAAKKHRV